VSEGRESLLPEVGEAERERYWREMEERAAPFLNLKGELHVIFRLRDALFAFEAVAGSGVFPWREPSPLPVLPRHILGTVVLLGRPVSVTRLDVLTGGERIDAETRPGHLLVVRWRQFETALAVDAVLSVERVDREGVVPAGHRWDGARRGLILGRVDSGGGPPVYLLDPRFCLMEEEPGRTA
jgi:chemotaxis signal transduction protein